MGRESLEINRMPPGIAEWMRGEPETMGSDSSTSIGGQRSLIVRLGVDVFGFGLELEMDGVPSPEGTEALGVGVVPVGLHV